MEIVPSENCKFGDGMTRTQRVDEIQTHPVFTPTTFMDALRYRASHSPQQIAYKFLTDGDEEENNLTYLELLKRSQAIAAHIQAVCTPAQRVLLLYPPGLDFIAGFYGCVMAGVVAVPAYLPRGKRNQHLLKTILADSGASLVLTLSSLQSAIEAQTGLTGRQLLSSDRISIDDRSSWMEPKIDGDSIVFLQYTSGSTSLPRGVILTHKGFIANALSIVRAWNIKESETLLSWLPVFHDMGFMIGVAQPVISGNQVVTMPPASFAQRPLRWLSAISKYRATISGAPNFAYDLCVERVKEKEKKNLDLSGWRVAFNGSEPIWKETLERFAGAFLTSGFREEALFPCYGLAEATLMVSAKRALHDDVSSNSKPKFAKATSTALRTNSSDEKPSTKEERSIVGSGKVLPDLEVVIVDPETQTPCTPDIIGEILVHGPSVARGYWNNPDETSKIFRATVTGKEGKYFLRTGDLGAIQDGEPFIAGRVKDLIIIRGANHYPQDFERAVAECHAALLSGFSAAFSVEAGNEERLVIVHEIKRSYRGKDLNAAVGEIRKIVAQRFDLQVYAVVLVIQGSIPKTSSGKIQRHACKRQYHNEELAVLHEWMQVTNDPENVGTAQSRPVAKEHTRDEIANWLVSRLSAMLNLDAAEIECSRPFADYGLDSINAALVSGELSQYVGRNLSPAVLYEFTSVNELARHLAPIEPLASGIISKDEKAKKCEQIAVVGIGCRFPGAGSLDDFWRLLRNGVDAVTEVPPERWDATRYYDPNPATPGKTNTKWGGFLKDADKFDAGFFNISPREAVNMDPQQRLLMEVAWHALEDAGCTREELIGAKCGSFIGISSMEYAQRILGSSENIGPYLATGNSASIAANRLAYYFNWSGPSLAVDTACSSSLVAVHLACRSIWDGESDLAIAGGANLILSPTLSINFTKAGVMSPDGRCRSFDARANGFVRSEGVGIVVLKPLSTALANRDRIYCTIRASSINQDGRSNGLMAPNGRAQAALLKEAYERAGLSASAVQFIEAHGSGTILGDSMELSALGEVLNAPNRTANPCFIGSVKLNIGHAESAAGIAGFIKTALALYHAEIPPSLHFSAPNPHVSMEQLGLKVPTALQPWPTHDRKFAGVSSFGFGGTNVHLVVEAAAAPVLATEEEDSRNGCARILPISAHSASALRGLVDAYGNLPKDGNLRDVCFTAACRRTHHSHRVAFVGSSFMEIKSKCDAFLSQDPPSKVHLSGGVRRQRKYAFVFPGHGSQWIGMGKQLLQISAQFRTSVEQCDREIGKHVPWSVIELLSGGDVADWNGIDVIQPALFALETGLVAVWRSWGIEPDAVVGQSMGEILAAHISGALSLEDAVYLTCFRGSLLKKITDRGGMLMVSLSFKEAANFIQANNYEKGVSIGISSSPVATVLSGDVRALAEIEEKLKTKDIFSRIVNIDYASHSSKVDPLHAEMFEGL